MQPKRGWFEQIKLGPFAWGGSDALSVPSGPRHRLSPGYSVVDRPLSSVDFRETHSKPF